jgi:tetratricopeptide (TPR) repeat protein
LELTLMEERDEGYDVLRQALYLALFVGILWLMVVFAAACLYDLGDWSIVKSRWILRVARMVANVDRGFYAVLLALWSLVCVAVSSHRGAGRAFRALLAGAVLVGLHIAAKLAGHLGHKAMSVYWDHPRLWFRDHFWLASIGCVFVLYGAVVGVFQRNQHGAPGPALRLWRNVWNRASAGNCYLAVLALNTMRFGRDHNAQSLMRIASLQRSYSHRSAIATYSRVLEEDPKHARAFHLRGDEYRATAQLKHAERDIRQALDLDPGDYRAMTCLAKTLELLENRSEAQKLYRRALELNPNYNRARLHLAWLHLEWGEDREAVAAFSQIIESDFADGDAFHGLFKCAVAMTDAKAARKYLASAVRNGRRYTKEAIKDAENELGARLQ